MQIVKSLMQGLDHADSFAVFYERAVLFFVVGVGGGGVVKTSKEWSGAEIKQGANDATTQPHPCWMSLLRNTPPNADPYPLFAPVRGRHEYTTRTVTALKGLKAGLLRMLFFFWCGAGVGVRWLFLCMRAMDFAASKFR